MTGENSKSLWGRVPVIIRAVIGGILVGMIAANIWPIFLVAFGMPVAAGAEITFLALTYGGLQAAALPRVSRRCGRIISESARYQARNGSGA
jgi:hypothetical protein